MIKVIILFMITINLAFGQVKVIKKGDPSPFDGFVITVEQEMKFRKLDKDNKTLKELNLKLKDLSVHQNNTIDILNKRVSLYQKHTLELSQDLYKIKGSNTFWNKTLFFMLGAGVTTGLVYGLKGALK